MNRVDINGRPATADQLAALAFAGYGHFTSMQLRDHRVRGLELHLQRLARDSRELLGRRWTANTSWPTCAAPPAAALVTCRCRSTCSAATRRPVEPDILVRTSRPVAPATTPVRVRTAVHERLLPQVKHVATLGLVYRWRRARQVGFDDVLFVDRDGFVSEGSIWNLAFFDGDGIVWPAAPALQGVTLQLVQAGLRREGVPSATRPVHVDDLPAFRSAVLMNSIIPGRPIVGVDGQVFEHDPTLLTMLLRCYESNEGQPVG